MKYVQYGIVSIVNKHSTRKEVSPDYLNTWFAVIICLALIHVVTEYFLCLSRDRYALNMPVRLARKSCVKRLAVLLQQRFHLVSMGKQSK